MFKKILATSLLGLAILSTVATGVHAVSEYYKSGATVNLPYNDVWTRGVNNPNNGYYMAYSYYKAQSGTYRAYSRIDSSGLSMSPLGSSWTTVCANSKSVPYHQNTKNSVAMTDQYGNIQSAAAEIDGGNEFLTYDVY